MALCGASLRALARWRYYHTAALASFSQSLGRGVGFLFADDPGEFLGARIARGSWTLGARIPSRCYSAVASCSAKPKDYDVEAWSDTPYLEYVVGLEPQGSTPATSTGGSTLAGVRDDKRPDPGYAARLIRLRIENGAAVKAREAILDEKSYMRDFGRFWNPMLADLLGGPHHHHSLEIFAWMREHPTVLRGARNVDLDRLYSIMISYAGVVGRPMLARSWFDDLHDKAMRKSTQCCNAVIVAYAKDRDIDSAMAIFRGMREFSRECPPNAMTFHILVAMFARYHHWEGMAAALKACRDAGFSPDLITYNTLLHAYAKMARRDLFESACQEMQQALAKDGEPFKRGAETFTALVIGYSRLDALDRVRQVLGEMQEEGSHLARNVAVAAVEEVAKAYNRNASAEGIETLLEFVEKTPEITSTSAFQSHIVEAYAKAERLDEIEHYFDRVCDRKAKFVEAPAFEAVVGAFGKRGKERPESGALEKLFGIYCRVRNAGFALSSSSFQRLVSEFSEAGCRERMEEVAADMKGARNKLPSQTLQVLGDAIDKSGSTSKFRIISRRSKQEEQQRLDATAAAC